MARKSYHSFELNAGIGTDYALIAAGVLAALIALIYLVLS
jgi:hypothetical protein